ncbi:MAG: exo-alpha-sialidase, partial [Bacteroidales bacterium]|nr:exo-alpha-sialidase [Bacteroidales bacterium]
MTSLCGVNSQSVTILQKQVPVLTLREGNQVMLIKLDSVKENTTVSSVSLDLAGTTDLDDLESIKIFYRGDNLQDSVQFGKTQSPSERITVKGKANLPSGSGYFSVSIRLKDDADILNSLIIKCSGIKAGKKTLSPGNDFVPLRLRLGTALCQHGEDGVHTYRIPGIVRTNNGTLLAIFDRRIETHRDPQGVVNIGLKRSTDGGRTWEPQQVIIDRGNWGGLPPRYNGVTDACILVNEKNNEIFVGALWMHGQWIDGKWVGIPDDPDAELGRKRASMPGMTEKETCQ